MTGDKTGWRRDKGKGGTEKWEHMDVGERKMN